MKRLTLLLVLTMPLLAAPGCSNSPDCLLERLISQMNDLSTAIDEHDSFERIKSRAEKVKTTMDRVNALKLADEEKTRLHDAYKNELEEAKDKLLKAMLTNPESLKATEAGGLGGQRQDLHTFSNR
jgi:hypothetical protein